MVVGPEGDGMAIFLRERDCVRHIVVTFHQLDVNGLKYISQHRYNNIYIEFITED